MTKTIFLILVVTSAIAVYGDLDSLGNVELSKEILDCVNKLIPLHERLVQYHEECKKEFSDEIEELTFECAFKKRDNDEEFDDKKNKCIVLMNSLPPYQFYYAEQLVVNGTFVAVE